MAGTRGTMDYTNIFESAFPPSDRQSAKDTRATDAAHRKIELQDPKDLTYLMANVSRAAREKIDRDLPPDALAAAATQGNDAIQGGAGEDKMRLRVEGLVDEYIRSTFAAAKDNLCINGMDSAELDAELAKAQEGEEIEPFDAKLAHRIQALAAQIEGHTLALANLRRSAPSTTAARFHEGFTRAAAEDDERLQRHAEEEVRGAMETSLNVGEVERLDEVRRTWADGAEKLGGLHEGLEGTVARMEKAKKAVGVLRE